MPAATFHEPLFQVVGQLLNTDPSLTIINFFPAPYLFIAATMGDPDLFEEFMVIQANTKPPAKPQVVFHYSTQSAEAIDGDTNCSSVLGHT